ncbi:hypothetical protein GOBAR_DD13282 [Gossypium barbadense]|nr:hypothetical protein GOBAR_DD13282 [Gossypium barbadense]
MDCSDHECDKLEMSFKGADGFPSFKVKKCGVRIMYEKDLQCHTTQSPLNFEHIHHHSTDKIWIRREEAEIVVNYLTSLFKIFSPI